MGAKINYTDGQQVGKCIFITEETSIIGGDGVSRRMGKFKCQCGNYFVSLIQNVVSFKVSSCGCIKGKSNITHGGTIDQVSSGYHSWESMKGRCRDIKNKEYKNYGAKGITVCDVWYNSYSEFIKDVGKRPTKNHTLDRFPNKKGNYEPGNVRWATPKQQANNTSRNILVEYKGQIKTFAEWCSFYNISYKSSHNRYFTLKLSMDEVIKRGIDNKNGIKIPNNDGRGNPKLTIFDIANIKSEYSTGGISYRGIAEKYKVNPMTIGRIVRGESWVKFLNK